MKYLQKHFDYALPTNKLIGCDATSFTGLEKYADDIKNYGQHMADMYLIKKDDSQIFSQLWNELENYNIFGEYTNMYPKTIDKAYAVIFKQKTPANSTRLPCNRVDVSFCQR